MNSFTSLLSALPKSPGMRIMHFCKEPFLIPSIQEYCIEYSDFCEYLVATFNEIDLEQLSSYKNSFTQIKYLNENRPRFNIQSKLYDYLFITTLPSNRINFFKKVYSALKNAAPIFIFLQKDDTTLAYTLQSELIETNYVAVNKIELEDYLVVSAKKMHGWSGS